MSVIRWKSLVAVRAESLCATCAWGTVRKGYRGGEIETFCRFVSPNTLVPFPVRQCTDYNDRRVPSVPVEAKSTDRRFGFVTTLSLNVENERADDPGAATGK